MPRRSPQDPDWQESSCDAWNRDEPLEEPALDANHMRSLDALVSEWALRTAREDDERIEDDLLAIFGTADRALHQRKHIEIVRQHAPNGAVLAQYRGIRIRGKWRIDHFPDWPMRDEPLEEDE